MISSNGLRLFIIFKASRAIAPCAIVSVIESNTKVVISGTLSAANLAELKLPDNPFEIVIIIACVYPFFNAFFNAKI